jgi:hypothetical protein
LFKSQ